MMKGNLHESYLNLLWSDSWPKFLARMSFSSCLYPHQTINYENSPRMMHFCVAKLWLCFCNVWTKNIWKKAFQPKLLQAFTEFQVSFKLSPVGIRCHKWQEICFIYKLSFWKCLLHSFWKGIHWLNKDLYRSIFSPERKININFSLLCNTVLFVWS